jgi:PHD/YefM family antitoxin component YafN of YafNO toxin-antitoxin module
LQTPDETMPITTISSREFNRDRGSAKRAAESGPVFITDRGKPAHVLLSIAEYRRLQREPEGTGNIADLLAMPGAEDIDLDLLRFDELARSAEFD